MKGGVYRMLTFIQTKRKLIEHGAKFVIGLFLAKTIAFEDEQE